jgi:hypothetical protein
MPLAKAAMPGQHPGRRPEIRPVRHILVGGERRADRRMIQQAIGFLGAVNPEGAIADDHGLAA